MKMILFAKASLCLALLPLMQVAFCQEVALKYNGSGSYSYIERTNLRRYDNGKYVGLVNREVRSFIARTSAPAGANPTDSYYDGSFFVDESTLRNYEEVRDSVSGAIPSSFKISQSGELTMLTDFGYPSFRSFPAFPTQKIKVGDKWQAKVERVVDPLNNGIITKMPILVEYTYLQDDVFNDEEVYVFSAQWATRYGLSYWDYGGDKELKSAQGSHKATMYVSKKTGNALVVRDQVDETFVYKDGNSYAFKGTISMFTEYPPAYDKRRLYPALQRVAGLSAEELERVLQKPADGVGGGAGATGKGGAASGKAASGGTDTKGSAAGTGGTATGAAGTASGKGSAADKGAASSSTKGASGASAGTSVTGSAGSKATSGTGSSTSSGTSTLGGASSAKNTAAANAGSADKGGAATGGAASQASIASAGAAYSQNGTSAGGDDRADSPSSADGSAGSSGSSGATGAADSSQSNANNKSAKGTSSKSSSKQSKATKADIEQKIASAQGQQTQRGSSQSSGTGAPKSTSSAEKKVTVESTASGIRLTMQNLNFKPDSAELLPGEAERLDQIAAVLKEVSDQMFLVEGHTASVGKVAGEKQLSVERANAIAETLVKRGIPRERFICKGSGGTKPVASNSTSQGRAKNRRVEITILE